ncbi:MAG: ABC transporter permease [Actinocatenispora sp.]
MSTGAQGDVRLGRTTGVGLVARRELATRLRSKAFVISTVIMLVFIGGYIVLMSVIGNISTHSTIGLTGSTTSLSSSVQTAAKATGEVVETPTVDERAGRRQVADGTLDALLVGDPTHLRVIVKKDLKGQLRAALNTVAQQQALHRQIKILKGSPEKVDRVVASTTVPVTALQHAQPYQVERIVLGIVGAVLIYMSLMMNGQAVAQGVIEEKSSRVVELLLAAVRPWQLMAGKVLGIAAVGLLQMVIFAAVGVGLGLSTGVLDVPASLVTTTALWVLVWFVLGFLMYAVMLAAAGALVSRQEDAQSVVTPVMMMIVVPAVIGWSLLPSNPDSGLGEVLSMIPLFSPMLMPMRIALGVAPVWEVALSVVLSVLLVIGLVALAGRVYHNAVLRTGARVKLSEALRRA